MNSNVPTLNREASRAVDQRAICDFGMSGLVLMENAGRGVADKLEELGIGGRVVIVCGKGNNAGDGFVIARHLELRRHPVSVLVIGDPSSLVGDALANYNILSKTDVPIEIYAGSIPTEQVRTLLRDAAWIVDALLGTGAQGPPRAPLDHMIRILNHASARKLAVDVPSGLDCDTGKEGVPTFRADYTCTFVAAKPGFYRLQGPEMTGEVHVLDIGAPRRLVDEELSKSGFRQEPG